MEEQNLTLGQRIAAYRTRVHLSQDSLAELLEVSRQSVSKWETDASTPELSKLVRLSQVFGVSLDELVLGEAAGKADEGEIAAGERTVDAAARDTEAVAEALRSHRQKIAGIVLLAVGGVACFLQIGLLILIWPLLLLGLLCLTAKRVTGLGIGWLLWLSVVAMVYGYTSVNLFMVFHKEAYGVLSVPVAIAWALWLWLAVLMAVSVRRFRTGKADLPEWPEIGVMTAMGLAITVYYQWVFGLHFYRSPMSCLVVAVLGLLILLKLCRKKTCRE